MAPEGRDRGAIEEIGGEDDLLGCEPGAKRACELAGRDRVDPRALLPEQARIARFEFAFCA
jgi:hypothetical protein